MGTLEKSICFISRAAHYVLFNKTEKLIGGAEFQQVIIAKALRERGWQVSFITEKYDQTTLTEVNGIRIFPVIDYTSGNRYLKRTILIPIQLWKSMKMANAQLYYQRNPGPFSTTIGIFCKCNGKRFILAGANDANFDRKNELNVSSFIDILDIRYGIKLASKIILQNKRQRFLLKKYYHRDGDIFYNLYERPSSIQNFHINFEKPNKPRLLWVGRLAKQKRPELCLQLAGLLPDYEILMVGSRTHQKKLSERVEISAKNLPNLSYLGHLSLIKTEDLFDSVLGLINTSYVEGFPNTFLQAWSRGIPVFSFIDPDNLITKNNLGVKVSSINAMADSIRDKIHNRELFLQQSSKIKSFFKKNFTVTNKAQSLEMLLLSD